MLSPTPHHQRDDILEVSSACLSSLQSAEICPNFCNLVISMLIFFIFFYVCCTTAATTTSSHHRHLLLDCSAVLDTINIPNRKDGSPRQPFFSALIPATEQRWQQQQTSATPSSPPQVISLPPSSPCHFSVAFVLFPFRSSRSFFFFCFNCNLCVTCGWSTRSSVA